MHSLYGHPHDVLHGPGTSRNYWNSSVCRGGAFAPAQKAVTSGNPSGLTETSSHRPAVFLNTPTDVVVRKGKQEHLVSHPNALLANALNRPLHNPKILLVLYGGGGLPGRRAEVVLFILIDDVHRCCDPAREDASFEFATFAKKPCPATLRN